MPCPRAIPTHPSILSQEPEQCHERLRQPRPEHTAPTCQVPLTLVEEHVACIEGDTSEDVIGGTGVALVHPLNLHIQPVGEQSRAQGCWEPPPQFLAQAGAAALQSCSPPVVLSTEEQHFATAPLQGPREAAGFLPYTQLLDPPGAQHTLPRKHPELPTCSGR